MPAFYLYSSQKAVLIYRFVETFPIFFGVALLAAVVSLIYFDGLIARAGLRLLWCHVPAGGSCQM